MRQKPISLEALNRYELEDIALVAASEVKALRQLQYKRDALDLHILVFSAGIFFTVSAVLLGIALH